MRVCEYGPEETSVGKLHSSSSPEACVSILLTYQIWEEIMADIVVNDFLLPESWLLIDIVIFCEPFYQSFVKIFP
jgi:hypothetical protein